MSRWTTASCRAKNRRTRRPRACRRRRLPTGRQTADLSSRATRSRRGMLRKAMLRKAAKRPTRPGITAAASPQPAVTCGGGMLSDGNGPLTNARPCISNARRRRAAAPRLGFCFGSMRHRTAAVHPHQCVRVLAPQELMGIAPCCRATTPRRTSAPLRRDSRPCRRVIRDQIVSGSRQLG